MRISNISARSQGSRASASRLEKLFDLPQENHQILDENLSSYLFQWDGELPEAALQNRSSVLSYLKDQSVAATPEAQEQSRWPKKIYKALQDSYTDAEVGAHLDDLATRLDDLRDTINQTHDNYEPQFFLFGSSCKGRFGAHSDFDLFVGLPAGAIPEGKTHTFFNEGEVNACGLPEEVLRARGYAEGKNGMHTLDKSRPGQDAARIVHEGLAAKGLQVKDGWLVERVSYPSLQYEIRQ